MKTETRNFHVPLSEELYAKLKKEAQKTSVPATVLAREAIKRWLSERERRAIHQQIVHYASKNAGTINDLDVEMEATSIAFLNEEEDDT